MTRLIGIQKQIRELKPTNKTTYDLLYNKYLNHKKEYHDEMISNYRMNDIKTTYNESKPWIKMKYKNIK